MDLYLSEVVLSQSTTTVLSQQHDVSHSSRPFVLTTLNHGGSICTCSPTHHQTVGSLSLSLTIGVSHFLWVLIYDLDSVIPGFQFDYP